MAEESKAAEPCLNVLTEENLQQMTKKKRSFSETGTQVSGGSEENSKEMKEADTSNENTAGSSTSSAHSNNMNAGYPPPKKAKFDLKGANVIDLTADAQWCLRAVLNSKLPNRLDRLDRLGKVKQRSTKAKKTRTSC